MGVLEISDTVKALLAASDEEAAQKWIREILEFDQSNAIFVMDDTGNRKDALISELSSICSESEMASQIVASIVAEKASLIDLYLSSKEREEALLACKKTIEALELKVAESSESFNEAISRSNQYKQELDSERKATAQLRRELEQSEERAGDFKRRHQAQIAINETLQEKMSTLEEKRCETVRVHVAETGHMREMIDALAQEKDSLLGDIEALRSDVALRTAEAARLKTASANTESKAKNSLLKDIVSGINEQIYYLAQFHAVLVETSTLDAESIELFGDVLDELTSALFDVGAERYGDLGETVEYDSSLHESSDILSNGDKVRTTGYGWKIEDEPYIKANVESIEG